MSVHCSTTNYYSISWALASRPLTMACWCKLHSDLNSYATILEHILNNTGSFIYVGTNTNGTTLYISTASSGTDIGALTVDAWHYLGVRVNASGVAQGFMSPAGGGTLSFVNVVPTVPSYNSATVYVVYDLDATPGDAAIQNVQLWSAYLTDAELAAQQWRQNPVVPCAAHWPLIDVTHVADISGNGHTLSKTGTPTTEAGPPVPWNSALLL